MWPFLPVAQPFVVLAMPMACKLSVVPPVDCVAQLVPLKKSIVWPSQAAQTWVASTAWTAWCLLDEPMVWVDQLLPLLFENTVAVSPTAQMCAVSRADTPFRLDAVPDVWAAHVVPL